MTEVMALLDGIAPSPIELKRASRAEPLIYDGIRPDLCRPLAAVIGHLSERGGSGPSLNRGGWKSTDQFFRLPYEPIAELARTMAQLVGSHATTSWAMINRLGSEHRRHQHRGAVIMAVYYVTGGDPLVPTTYECADGSVLEVHPGPGRLVICPGETWHAVARYDGEKPRITIAADYRNPR